MGQKQKQLQCVGLESSCSLPRCTGQGMNGQRLSSVPGQSNWLPSLLGDNDSKNRKKGQPTIRGTAPHSPLHSCMQCAFCASSGLGAGVSPSRALCLHGTVQVLRKGEDILSTLRAK